MSSKNNNAHSPQNGRQSSRPQAKEAAPTSILPIKIIILGTLALIVLGLLAYSNSFDAAFHLDDESFILNNPYVHQIKDLWATGRGVINSHSRIVTFITFALNYHFSGGNVFGYHLFNFLILLISAFSVWGIGHMLFKTPRLINEPLARTSTRILIPLLVALIFITHPVNTQAITYISQRFESMASMFYLLAFWLFLWGRLTKNNQARPWLFFGSISCALLGMLTKEIVMTLPVMIVAAELAFLRETTNAATARKIRWAVIMTTGLLLLVIPIMFRFNVSGSFIPQVSGCHENELISPLEYILTQFRVLATFLRLIFLPINQNFDYDFPKSSGLFDPVTTFLSLIMLAGLLWLSFRERKKNILFSFGIWWFFIALSVNFLPRRYVISEHKLFLPAIGIYWAVLAATFANNKHIKEKTSVIILIILSLTAMTFTRNNVWKTEESLWLDGIKKSPHKYPPHMNLGLAYLRQNRYEEALIEFNKAIEILPSGYLAYNNRGVAYYDLGLLDEAIQNYHKSIELRPEEPEAYENRGLAYSAKGDYEKALADFNKGLELIPRNEAAYLNRADLYMKLNEDKKALADYSRAIELNPMNPESYNRRSQFFLARHMFQEALNDCNQAISVNPSNPSGYVSRGNLFSDTNQLDKSLADYRKALQLGPRIAGIYFNIGNILSKQQNYPEALDYYGQTLLINPSFLRAYINRAVVYYSMGNFKRSEDDLLKALFLEPNDPNANNNLARLYAQTGNNEKLSKHLEDMRRKGLPAPMPENIKK